MRRPLIPLLAAGLLSGLSSAAEAAPADVVEIDKVSKAIQANASLTGDAAEKALLGEFTRLVVIQAAWIADAQGIGKLTQVRSPGFSAHVKRSLKPLVSKAADIEEDKLRKDEWYEILRNHSTESAGHRALASWMDFEAPGAYLSKAKRGDPPRVTEQVSAVSTDARLKILEDKVTLGGEIGGPGEGNGVIDAGEWVSLGLQVYNDDDRGFFSSSAWVETQAACAWVPPALEIEMEELPATEKEEEASGKVPKLSLKKKDPPTQGLNAWVYLSKACGDGAVVPLQVRIKDTHRAPEVPIVVSAKMDVRNRTNARAVNFLVDTDVPGVSDGRSMREVAPARVFELTHGFEAPQAGLMSARTGWGIHEDVGSIVKEQQAASEPMINANNGNFLAGDDLDISTVKRSDFDRILQSRADDDRWDNIEDARAWFAADTEVLYETPDPPILVVEKTPDEICDNYLDDDGDGDHDCDDSDCKAEKVCNPAAPVAFGPLLNLIKSNVDIVANPAGTTIPGAVDAVEPGYELVVDADEIAQQYDCMVAGISPEQCGECTKYELSLDDCKSCLAEGTDLRVCGLDVGCEEEEKEEAVEVDTGRDPAVAYNYRNYFTLPLGWNPIESEDFGNCKDERDNDLDGLADSQDPDCDGRPAPVAKKPKPKKPKQPLGHRVDLGILFGQVVFADSDNESPNIDWITQEGAASPALMLNGRYVLTLPSLPIRPVVSYAMSPGRTEAAYDKEGTFSLSSIGGGLIYRLSFTDALALEARGLVNNRTYSIAPEKRNDESLFSEEVASTGYEAGLEVHYGFGGGLGVYAGVGAALHDPIKDGQADIVTTKLPAITAGLNYSFGN